MINIINILTRFSFYLFNLILETKYKIKVLITKNYKNDEIEIKNIYLVNLKNEKILNICNKNFISNTNELLKYSKHIILNSLIEPIKEKYQNIENYILDIEYVKNRKEYKVNLLINNDNKIVVFPLYSIGDIKNKNMNRIVSINFNNDIKDNYNDERLKLIEKYGGPLNDFYKTKDLGISLYNMYSVKYEKFLFRNVSLQMEDSFLNNYEITEENVKDVFMIKGGLEDNKLKENNENESYILSNYKKLDLNGKILVKGFFGYLFNIFLRKKRE